MDRNQSNGSCSRPYQSTCGMQSFVSSNCLAERKDSKYNPNNTLPLSSKHDRQDNSHRKALAMAYVPFQDYQKTYDLCHALQVGTIFPELCKPFCGKRGKKKC